MTDVKCAEFSALTPMGAAWPRCVFRGYPFVMIFLAVVIVIPPGGAHYGRNGFAGSARSLGDAQTIEIGTLALDNDVGFAFAKSGQSRVLFRDWIVGSVLAKQIWNASSVTAQEPPGYSRPKPSICFGFVLRSVGEPGAPLMKPIRPARLATSKADSSASAAAGAAGLPVDAILLSSSRARRRIWSGDKALMLVRI